MAEGRGAAHVDFLGPGGAGSTAAQCDGLVVAKRQELVDFQAQHVPECARRSANRNSVVAVHDAGKVGDQQVTAGLDVVLEVGSSLVPHEVEGRGEYQAVPGQVCFGVREI